MSLSFDQNNSFKKNMSFNSGFSVSSPKLSTPELKLPFSKIKYLKKSCKKNKTHPYHKMPDSPKNDSLEMVLWNRERTKNLLNFYVDNRHRKYNPSNLNWLTNPQPTPKVKSASKSSSVLWKNAILSWFSIHPPAPKSRNGGRPLKQFFNGRTSEPTPNLRWFSIETASQVLVAIFLRIYHAMNPSNRRKLKIAVIQVLIKNVSF